jgi:Protein of unknown function (DUF3500)
MHGPVKARKAGFQEGATMKRCLSSRWLLAAGFLALWFCGVRAAERSATAMATAADGFLKSLTPDQRRQASFPFESDERLHWHFIPTDMFPRNGLTIKAMSEPQRALARHLLEVGLSQAGYRTATAIMEHENILGALEAAGQSSEPRPGARMVRDPERYFFSVFGTPSATGTWGWRVEGHHVSLHFTVVNGTLLATSPTFFGSNPAEVREGPKKGLRILSAEEDSARGLFVGLTPAHQKQALINTAAPGDIVTMNKLQVDPLSPVGVAAGALDARERDLLMKVVDSYVSLMASDIAEDRMARLRKAGLDKITFAWAGEIERGKKHYYRVQGPTFLIEYDNTQNDANHIHSIWRDFDGDFGRDLLREHLKAVAH